MGSRIYDNWDRLIGATLKREQFRELARAHSLDPSISSISSDFSSIISLSSPVHYQSLIKPEGPSRRIPRSPDWTLQLPVVKPISFFKLRNINATRNFRPNVIIRAVIGEGIFGRVFKGWINKQTLTGAKLGSGTTVAIKQLNPIDFPGFNKWLATMTYLAQLQHPNLIKLIAYCHEGNNLLLVYEFIPRGSLDDYLFKRGYKCLPWATRVKVAVDVARGLSFLHEAKNHVIHRDINPAHILLDEEFNAKLSGLYLAKDVLPGDKTDVSTRILGIYGYAAPEYVARGQLTEKCDVYGFGVVLLQLLSGRRAIDRSTYKILVDWARPYLSKKKVDQVMDAKLEGQYNKEEAVIVANIALECVSHQPERRPRMADVLAALERI